MATLPAVLRELERRVLNTQILHLTWAAVNDLLAATPLPAACPNAARTAPVSVAVR
ncbi:hypothetical protein AURDEDRAFT_175827 [Auricularia subglabra TFB-10046 SS5]|uniref:Uncharacterized protein n=1 Tax=Auricularia subglabra (strain TFB-10046 / SS5) TaxID=717982 RepID=J0WR14_AURST|nr:hypothetical protein AURDEDRAFT_175827 [Auricularia subglabra TFB-10046 SS5]